MATPLHTTDIEGTAEGMPDINYVALLKCSLRAQNLMYITDIIMEIEKEPLEDLMDYSRNNLIDLLDEIHENEKNGYRIKVSHRNKFAKTVIQMGTRKNQSLETQTVAASASATSQVKLLFVGEEEQEAIRCIQSSQQLMGNNLIKIKKSFRNLDENDKMVRHNLSQICNALKQKSDQKQKQMLSILDSIYKYRLNELNERHSIIQKSAKITAKFHNEYESYFVDNALSKLDRRNKLIAAQNRIEVEARRASQCNKHSAVNMDIKLNKNAVNQFFNQCLDLTNIGINLPVVSSVKVYGTVMKWKAPEIHDILALFSKRKSAEISYRIFYCNGKKEQKMDAGDWDVIPDIVTSKNQYDMAEYAPCEARIEYSIYDVLRSETSKTVKIESIQNDDAKVDDPIATRWNSRGNMARLGVTGKYYCGASVNRRCSCCNGKCGPTNGCNCCSCMELDVKCRMLPKRYLVNKLGFASRISSVTGKFYCGRKIGKKQTLHDGHCGPDDGPNCVPCKVLDANANKMYSKLWK